MADRLKGKRIIITGAVSNIGKEAVRGFVAEGARVVIGDRDAAGATTAAEFGPSVSWMISRNKKQYGAEVNDSGRETISVGADVYYRFSKISVTATYLYDAHVENSTKGHFFQIKTVYRF